MANAIAAAIGRKRRRSPANHDPVNIACAHHNKASVNTPHSRTACDQGSAEPYGIGVNSNKPMTPPKITAARVRAAFVRGESSGCKASRLPSGNWSETLNDFRLFLTCACVALAWQRVGSEIENSLRRCV